MRSLIFVLILAIPATALGEVVCSSDIHYTWKREGAEDSFQENWARVERKAESEDMAKAATMNGIELEKVRASSECTRKHENFAGCVSSKFTSMKPIMAQMSFTARKSLEDAVNADCKSFQGKCLGVKSSDIACLVTKPAEGEGEGEEEDGKDKKKKDKKSKKKK